MGTGYINLTFIFFNQHAFEEHKKMLIEFMKLFLF